ncbi:MAG TPA: alpha amylase C-terminal domain-containing protein, partial [Actinomycetota bacterium]|nr:alpha amylase C-terminal domain-containing protein [Actinomycetota bacterium]
WGQNGKKLLFMGDELGQVREWDHEESLDWHVLQYPLHAGVQRWVEDLNRAHRFEPALHEMDCEPGGFEWIDANDTQASVITFLRKGRSTADLILVACNFTPVPRTNYLVGVPRAGTWREILNSDAQTYGGSGWGNLGGLEPLPVSKHGRPRAINLTLPPLGCLYLKNVGEPADEAEPAGETS